jgi:hypothetical protein
MLGGLGLLGCGVTAPIVSIDDNVTTVALASWSADGPARTRIEVENADGPWLVSDWQEAGIGLSVPLVGLFADTEYTARATTEGGDESADVSFTTGSLPASIPGYSVAGTPGWQGYMLTGLVSDPSAVVILDEAGHVVWYHLGKKGLRALRVRLLPDGSGIRYASIEAVAIPDKSELVSVDWAGTTTRSLPLPLFTHDFVDDGADAVGIFNDVRPGRSGSDVAGDAIRHIDGETGETTPIWSTWDSWEVPSDSEIAGGSWTHANTLDAAAGGGWWVGMRNQSRIVEISEDGQLGRQLGGDESTWSFPDPADAPKFQHGFQFLDEGRVVIFDDRDPATGEDSRLLELSLAADALTASAASVWLRDRPVSVYALGDVDRAADGSTLVTFSSAGLIDDVSPGGDLRWELQTQLASGVSYLVRVAELPGMTRVR